jgi:hypothetical protein
LEKAQWSQGNLWRLLEGSRRKDKTSAEGSEDNGREGLRKQEQSQEIWRKFWNTY